MSELDFDEVRNFYLTELKKESRSSAERNDKKIAQKVSNNSKTESNECELKSVKNKNKNVEVVVFKRRKPKQNQPVPSTKAQEPEVELDLKTDKILDRLQWDVTSYGLKGFSKEERRKFEEERAVKLGAKPKKREYVNYKVLMEERKRQKLEMEDKSKVPLVKPASATKKNKKKPAAKTVFWKEPSKAKTFGEVGRFKNGVLQVSAKNIRSLKSKRK